jgi:hypothetical protein
LAYPSIFAANFKKPVPMKKLIALAMVCGFALAFIACGGGSTKDESNDAAADTSMMAPDTTATDSTGADSTAAK